MSSSPADQRVLQSLHSAAFSISLDSSPPSTLVAHSRDCWHGPVSDGVLIGLRNRWVDKPIQYVVFDHAEAGFMGEHSVMDGTPMVRMCDEILGYLVDPAFDQRQSVDESSKPQAMDREFTKATEKAIAQADNAAMDLINSQTLEVLETRYGKAAIKKFGISPDAYTQFIVQ